MSTKYNMRIIMLKFLTNYGANESANELGRRKKKDKEKSTKI